MHELCRHAAAHEHMNDVAAGLMFIIWLVLGKGLSRGVRGDGRGDFMAEAQIGPTCERAWPL